MLYCTNTYCNTVPVREHTCILQYMCGRVHTCTRPRVGTGTRYTCIRVLEDVYTHCVHPDTHMDTCTGIAIPVAATLLEYTCSMLPVSRANGSLSYCNMAIPVYNEVARDTANIFVLEVPCQQPPLPLWGFNSAGRSLLISLLISSLAWSFFVIVAHLERERTFTLVE